jgi:hypothetical protein
MKDNILIATRVPCFDAPNSNRPYGVVMDIYDKDYNLIENGTDWVYFKTEKEAENFCNKYNKTK